MKSLQKKDMFPGDLYVCFLHVSCSSAQCICSCFALGSAQFSCAGYIFYRHRKRFKLDDIIAKRYSVFWDSFHFLVKDTYRIADFF